MDAQKHSFLLKLAADNGGELTAEQTVEAARDESSPIHDDFCWDDTEAAERYRLEQARTLIRTIRIEILPREVSLPRSVAVEYVAPKPIERNTAKMAMPGFVRDPTKGATESGYMTLERVASDVSLSRAVLADEMSRVKALLVRAEGFAVCFGMQGEIVGLRTQIDEFVKRVETAELVEKEEAA